MKNYCLYLLLLGSLYLQPCQGQVNIMGKPGYMLAPSAQWEADRQLGLSFSYLPREYSLFNFSGNRNTINFYNARVGITSFMEVNVGIAYRLLMADSIGIGDRQLDLRFRLWKEKKYRPSVVLGWTPPGSVSPMMAHDYLVATKNLNTGIGKFRLSAGYGSPYIFLKNRNHEGFGDLIRIKEKFEFFNADYLTGFFGGLAYMPVDFAGVMLEHDTRTFNAGAFLELWNWLYLQGYSLEGKEWAFTFSAHFPLDFAPFSLRQYEKNLD